MVMNSATGGQRTDGHALTGYRAVRQNNQRETRFDGGAGLLTDPVKGGLETRRARVVIKSDVDDLSTPIVLF